MISILGSRRQLGRARLSGFFGCNELTPIIIWVLSIRNTCLSFQFIVPQDQKGNSDQETEGADTYTHANTNFSSGR